MMLLHMAQLTTAVSISGVDLQGHLLGVQAVVQVQRDQSSSPPDRTSDFRQACLWSAFRHELYVGFMEHRQLRCDAPTLPLDSSTWDDWTWSLKAVSDCAEVVNCVFDSNHHNVERIALLAEQITAWDGQKPKSFEPFMSTAWCSSTGFPDSPLLASCHGTPDHRAHKSPRLTIYLVMAQQYRLMSTLLVAAHKELPSVGPQRKQAMREVDVSTLLVFANWNGNFDMQTGHD